MTHELLATQFLYARVLQTKMSSPKWEVDQSAFIAICIVLHELLDMICQETKRTFV